LDGLYRNIGECLFQRRANLLPRREDRIRQLRSQPRDFLVNASGKYNRNMARGFAAAQDNRNFAPVRRQTIQINRNNCWIQIAKMRDERARSVQ